MMAKGLARASRAIAMASKPMPANAPGLRNPEVPVISPAPATPAKAPDSAIDAISVPLTLMPAYFAALALVPTVRTTNPKLVRRKMNHTSAQRAMATKKPRCRGGSVDTISGIRAEAGSRPVRGTEARSSRRMMGSCELTIHRTIKMAMLLSMIVTITS